MITEKIARQKVAHNWALYLTVDPPLRFAKAWKEMYHQHRQCRKMIKVLDTVKSAVDAFERVRGCSKGHGNKKCF